MFATSQSRQKSRNEEFYKELAKTLDSERFLESINRDNNLFNTELKGLYFSLKDLHLGQNTDYNLKLAYKIFHRDFLHREFKQKDSNELDKDFYKELLYIMGLEETKERKLIPSKETLANQGTLYAAIAQKLGKNDVESIMPYLITWLNRILFLKLIEANLVQFNDDTNLCFLDSHKIPDFATLNHLFFDIFAKDFPQREWQKDNFYYLPYLNSSLFSKQGIEEVLEISKLDELHLTLEYHPQSQLKEQYNGGKSELLTYLLDFLNAFNFGKQKQTQSDDIQILQAKPPILIKSSILGSFFELLNGYKEGSFYTPSFITSYMCERAIEKVVLDKFNKHFELKARNIKELERDLRDFPKSEVKRAFLEVKICDPAVGSGYFLVSALHTLLKLYEDLNLFENDFRIEILDDEIVAKSRKGNPIYYKRPDSVDDENHQIQKELFTAKKEIIESCLFGVDINPNSCEIARLRLWIELLKHSYYTDRESNALDSLPDTSIHPLATLPNNDINIKDGNSLISNFEINESDQEGKPLPNTLKWLINQNASFANNFKEQVRIYKENVSAYKNALRDKATLVRSIENIKQLFKTCLLEVTPTHANLLKNLKKFVESYGDEAFDIETPFGMEMIKLIRKKQKEQGGFRFQPSLEQEPRELDTQGVKLLDSIRSDFDTLESLRNADTFEWRFAFPEVLDSNGDFKGFDLVIGNPPYIKEDNNKKSFENTKNLRTYQGKMDIWYHFVGRGFDIAKNGAIISFIATNNWTTSAGAKNLRNVVLKESKILSLLDFGSYMCFDSASIQTMIMAFQKLDSIPTSYPITYAKIESKKPTDTHREAILQHTKTDGIIYLSPIIKPSELINKTLTFVDSNQEKILEKMQNNGEFYLGENEIAQGIVPNPDVITNRNMNQNLKNTGVKIGDGVFVIPKHTLAVTHKEKQYLKPLFEAQHCDKYHLNLNNTHEIIYTTKKNCTIEKIPNLAKHLARFRDIMDKRRENINGKLDFFHLHWARDEKFFKQGEKILAVRKCIDYPIFSYTSNEAYVLLSINIIQTNRLDMKYLTGILNSKLIAFWLRYKGKMQGNHYQIDKEPLLNIPIPKITESNQDLCDKIINLVEQILESKAKDSNADTTELESQIDSLVYRLYNLTDKEIDIIES